CPGPDAGVRCIACLAEHGAGELVKRRFDYMARMLALPGAIVAPSRALAARYGDELPFLAGRIELVEPGLAHPPERLGAGRQYRAAGQAPLRLLFIGTLLPHKGVDLLLSSLQPLDPRRYALDVYGAGVAGHDGYLEELRQLARDKPVRFLGRF